MLGRYRYRDGEEVKIFIEWAGSIVVEFVNFIMEWELSVFMVKED